jgi:hypothetical protein
MKARLSALEDTIHTQKKKNELIDQVFTDVDLDMRKIEAVAEKSLAQLQEKIYTEMAEIKKVFEQR